MRLLPFELALPLDHARTIDRLSSRSVRVRVAAVHECADEHPTFLEIDIEGGEDELLRTDLGGLRHAERVFLELHPFFIENRGLETAVVLRNDSRQGFDLHDTDPSHPTVDAETEPVCPGMWFLARRGTATEPSGGAASR